MFVVDTSAYTQFKKIKPLGTLNLRRMQMGKEQNFKGKTEVESRIAQYVLRVDCRQG